jgi:hypothetical protein
LEHHEVEEEEVVQEVEEVHQAEAALEVIHPTSSKLHAHLITINRRKQRRWSGRWQRSTERTGRTGRSWRRGKRWIQRRMSLFHLGRSFSDPD